MVNYSKELYTRLFGGKLEVEDVYERMSIRDSGDVDKAVFDLDLYLKEFQIAKKGGDIKKARIAKKNYLIVRNFHKEALEHDSFDGIW